MSQWQRSEGPIDSTGPALYPAGHLLESRNKKREPPATFPFLYSQKQKCTRNLICGWKHLATRKKQLAVFSGHGLFRTNTYRTFCGSGGYDLCRAAGYDASLLDAVRTRSEGGRSSHTRMHSFTHNPRRTQHGARTTQSPPRRAIQCTHDARTTARTSTRTLTTTGRIVNSDTQRPGAVRKWSEGGIPSRTRAHSRTNHFTQAQPIPRPPFPSSPRHQPHPHASMHARTHARFPHAEYYTPSSQSCKGKRQQWIKLLARLSRNLLCSPSTLILCEY